MEIPYEALPDETLENMIVEFVTRDGTDYGENETSLADKVAQVKAKLIKTEAVICYDERAQTCEIILK